MNAKTLAVAALAATVFAAAPAAAQMETMQSPSGGIATPAEQVTTQSNVGTVLGAGALPGVGMETTTTTETNSRGGPGGLSGGVGAAGVAVPGLMSGAPAGSTPSGGGIPFETTPGMATNPPR